jgi:hypothetical protein
MSTGRRITLPLSFDDDSVVTATDGVIVVQRSVGELVRADFVVEVFPQLDDATKKNLLTNWINIEFAKSKLASVESQLSLIAATQSTFDFVQQYAYFAQFHEVLEFATTISTAFSGDGIVGTLDQFLDHCGVAALSDADAAASRERFAAVMDAWWRQLRSLKWKTENGVVSGYDRLFVAAATDGSLASELEVVHPISQSLLFSLFTALRRGLGTLVDDLWLFTELDLDRGGWAPLHGVDRCDKEATVDDDAAIASATASNDVGAESILAVDAQSGAHWVGARQGFSKVVNDEYRNTDAAIFLHRNRGDGRAPFNRCAQKKVVWTFQFKCDMSEQSVHEAEVQMYRDYAAVAGSTLYAVAPLMFAMVSNGAKYRLYKLSTGEDGRLRLEASEIFNIATEAALVQLPKEASEWCASFGADAANAGVDTGLADAVAFPMAFERIVRHLIKSVDHTSRLPNLPVVATGFVPPALSFAVANGSLTVKDVLAVTRRNVVARCEVRKGDSPAEQCVIKMRIAPSAKALASVQAEVAGVDLCKELFELFPYPPPKLIGTLFDRAILYEHINSVPISECCTCSAAKRKRVHDLLLRDIAPIREVLTKSNLLYVDWHNRNVLADNAENPNKLFLVDFESVMEKDGKPLPTSLFGTVKADWAAADESNWNQLLAYYS